MNTPICRLENDRKTLDFLLEKCQKMREYRVFKYSQLVFRTGEHHIFWQFHSSKNLSYPIIIYPIIFDREVCQRCDMKGEVEIFAEDLEAEVYINSWDLFLEVVITPFQVIVFVLWLQHTFPQDAWVYFKSIKSIYADRSTSVYHLMQMTLRY